MELEKIGTRTVLGTYIIEGSLAYVEQEEEGKVTVVTINGIRDIVPINDLEKFIKTRNMPDEIREELEGLVSLIFKRQNKGVLLMEQESQPYNDTYDKIKKEMSFYDRQRKRDNKTQNEPAKPN